MTYKVLIISLTIILISNKIYGTPEDREKNYTWYINQKSKPKLKVIFTKGLTTKQVKTIEAGFTTYSRLEMIDTDSQELISQTSCTVVYDLWEEKYTVISSKSPTLQTITGDLNKYTDECLSLKVEDDRGLKFFKDQEKKVRLQLHVEQLSEEKIDEVRLWLLEKQASSIKEIFRNLLEDPSLKNSVYMETYIKPPSNYNSPKKKRDAFETR